MYQIVLIQIVIAYGSHRGSFWSSQSDAATFSVPTDKDALENSQNLAL